MEKLKQFEKIKNFRSLILFLKENLEFAKKILAVAVVIFALAVFWIFGGEEDLVLEDAADLTAQEQEETAAAESENYDSNGESAGDIYVDIGGEIYNPGVYKIPEGTRLFQVVEEAGGLKETADTDSINQAEAVRDGQKIIIGSRSPESPYYTGSQWTEAVSGAVSQNGDEQKININEATLEELQRIPGVGPSTAQKILDYRNKNGSFGSISDIKNISGIGEKTYNNLKEYIEV